MNQDAATPVVAVFLIVAIILVVSAITYAMLPGLGGKAPPEDLTWRKADDKLVVIQADGTLLWEDFKQTGCASMPTGTVSSGDALTGCTGKVRVVYEPTGATAWRGVFG